MRRNPAQTPLHLAIFAVLALVFCFAACASEAHGVGGNGTGTSGAGAGGAAPSGTTGSTSAAADAAVGGASAPTQCIRAAGLDGPGAPRDSCTSARAYVTCHYPGDVTGACLSDSDTRCPDGEEALGVAAIDCKNECAPSEYAVSCGGIGPNVGNASPPESCRALGRTPAGPGFYCCPCVDPAESDAGLQNDLVGTWTYSGQVPARVNMSLTFNSDDKFVLVEELWPSSFPAGYTPAKGCATSNVVSGAYAVSRSGDVSTLNWTFLDGTANRVTGCDDASLDQTGTAMTPEAVASYISQGLIMPMSMTYSVSATTLVLDAHDDRHGGVARNGGTTFARTP